MCFIDIYTLKPYFNTPIDTLCPAAKVSSKKSHMTNKGATRQNQNKNNILETV